MLGAVVVTSLTVHFTILTHTTWFPAFLQGGKMPTRADVVPANQQPVSIGTATTGPSVNVAALSAALKAAGSN
jgi:hypothetical protein